MHSSKVCWHRFIAVARRRRRLLIRRAGALAATFTIVPLAIGVDPVDRDTSFTTFTVGIGAGSYADVARGCSGEVISARSRPVGDVGFGVEHEMDSAVLGVRATRRGSGIGGDDAVESWVANPHASYEGDRFGIGAGITLPDQVSAGNYTDEDFVLPLTGHIRTGNRARGTDFRISFGENVPAYSPGGGAEMTQGFRISRVVRGRVGVAGPVPFDQVGLIVRTNVRATDALTIELRGRLGQSEGVGESTIGVGVSYRIDHH